MAPVQVYCRVCKAHHERPVGRNCKRTQVGDAVATDGSVAGPSQVLNTATATATATPNDFNAQVLKSLSTISEQLVSLDGRVRQTEASLASRTTNLAVPTSPTNSSTASNVAAPNPTHVDPGVIPTIDFLRQNIEIQRQVDARVAELHSTQVLGTQGKLKSHRGGGPDIPIKRYVAWPQHQLLVGPDKKRPTYDQLTPFQFMAGCLKGALDLPDVDRMHALKYFTNLLEDASDFSFQSAKACHAVVLTTMEQDKLTWQNTDELDRLRRQHTQRHTTTVASQPAMTRSEKQREIPCKYYNDATCSKSESHITRGTWYLHICAKCRGDHKAKHCKPKN